MCYIDVGKLYQSKFVIINSFCYLKVSEKLELYSFLQGKSTNQVAIICKVTTLEALYSRNSLN